MDAAAREAFGDTLDVLGRPKPPTSPEKDWWGPVKDAPVGVVVGKVGDRALARMGEVLDGPPPALPVGSHD